MKKTACLAALGLAAALCAGFAAAPAQGQSAEDLFRQARAAKSPDEKMRLYTEYLRLWPNDRAAYNNRGNVYQSKGLYDQAIADYNKAIQLKPDHALSYYNRCGAFGRKNLLDSAVADCKRALELARQQGVPAERLKVYERRLDRYQKLKDRGGK